MSKKRHTKTTKPEPSLTKRPGIDLSEFALQNLRGRTWNADMNRFVIIFGADALRELRLGEIP